MTADQKSSGGGYDISAAISPSLPSAASLQSGVSVVGGGKAQQTALIVIGVSILGFLSILVFVAFRHR